MRCVEAVVRRLTERAKNTEDDGARDDVGPAASEGSDCSAGEATCYAAYVDFLSWGNLLIPSTLEDDRPGSW